ncbi:NAD-dependent epimerase/dehydratase family protein [Mangrovibacterium diazotrophicum]|uniref:Nucleoside-diphosphate-sugar epimerase n=1 Tax=Mangrovibacterium diazotrophicum TaxID=1261403 RepID=A0A419W5Q2_9BACT|nr:NAD(P)-dependent oxidoreductase [Mangrovibacterium diazotrophicum]RKD90777.1 nucleoside-diphosphate-sugar epimerase [Mangrovibacterium diazotrophicum]
MGTEKILITGASGFIGSNLSKYYSSKGNNVLNIDFKSPADAISGEIAWKNADITNIEQLTQIITEFQPDYILHFAARTDLGGKTLEDYNANTTGTENLILAAREAKNLKRIIFTSSMLVCGPGHIPKHPLEYAPTTVYGESKVEMEKIIRKYNHPYSWAIVRPTSIWGPGFGVPYRDFFDLVIKHSYFHIGNKASTKTYGYIGNVIYQVDSILNAPKEDIHEQVFYLGDYEPTNIQIWANEIAEQLQYQIKTIPYPLVKCAAFAGDFLKLVGLPFPMSSFRLKNMTTKNIVDLSNMKHIAPNLPFNRIEGIRQTLNWLKNN